MDKNNKIKTPTDPQHLKICEDVATLMYKNYLSSVEYPTSYVDIVNNENYTKINHRYSLILLRNRYKDYINMLFENLKNGNSN